MSDALYQDPPLKSKRVYATILAVVAAGLSIPEAQELFGPIAPMVAAMAAAAMAGMSKITDGRPLRQQ
jgi:hypothetical protein